MSDLTRRLTLAVLITVLSASTVSAQHRATYSQDNGPLLGPQLGFATNSLDFFIGGQFSYPVANQFDIYPSFDFFFPGNSVTVWAINAEGRYWPKLSMVNPGLYVGGGLDITHGSGGGGSASRAGLGLLGGWDFKAVSWRPFAQIHIVIGDADRVEFGGGVNFKL